MILAIPDIVTADELATLRQRLEDADYVDGRESAGWSARLVKNNDQLARGDPGGKELSDLVLAALRRHPTVAAACQPKAMTGARFSRYRDGQSYGTHIDNAIMSGEQRIRSDLSYTLFLAGPDEYEGGELVMEGAGGEQTVKLPAGAAVFYPTTVLHRVNPVTSGARLVAIGWIQSLVRAPGHRQILFDLDQVRRSLFARDGKSAEFDLLTKTHANLLREWAEI